MTASSLRNGGVNVHPIHDWPRRRRIIVRFAVVLVVVGCCSFPAQAYIDPNAGGLLFQILTPLLAVLVAGAVFLRGKAVACWHWTRMAVRRIFRKKKDR